MENYLDCSYLHFLSISKKLKETFSYKNVMEIPKLEKVVINMGVGEAVNDRLIRASKY